MDSQASSAPTLEHATALLPGWTALRADPTDADAAFAAGVALKSLDDLVRTEPGWAGCWRQRQALACAAIAVRLTGHASARNADLAALRDAALLTAPGDDPGPDGKTLLAFKRLAARAPDLASKTVSDLAERLSLNLADHLAAIVYLGEVALQSPRPPPIAAAELASRIIVVRPDIEPLAWALADMLIAKKLKWPFPVPLLMSQRLHTAFHAPAGQMGASQPANRKSRVSPEDPTFPRAVCVAFAEGADAALRSAADISRRAQTLASVAPKVRTKGAAGVLTKLLAEDAVLATAPGTQLSRWAATRMFERLERFGAVRELSGRSTFRMFGL